MLKDRLKKINNLEYNNGKILYWMSRDQRVKNNWSLIYAQKLAKKYNKKIEVLFCLNKEYEFLNERNFDFMISGLKEVEKRLIDLGIKFHFLLGNPIHKIPSFIKKSDIGFLITDFSPLKVKLNWENKIKKKLNIPFHKVDSHNIVPIWIASSKKEYAAYTIRKKINPKLDKYLTDFPNLEKVDNKVESSIDWGKIENLNIDNSVKKVNWIKPGYSNAKKILYDFIKNKLKNYSENSNNPSFNVLSNLSPYIHFGQISAQRIALDVLENDCLVKNKDDFLEQLIVRRELTDNYCYFEKNYDSIEGFPDWAKETLSEHQGDNREYIYSLSDFENAKTHDEYWNAAQKELLHRGKIHSYMRMYWAKKILEWTPNSEEAFKIAIYLNDKYSLDGRDPNGFVGVSWAIGGVHDRAFREREVYGKVRYMSKSGLDRKFDMKKYVKKVNNKSLID